MMQTNNLNPKDKNHKPTQRADIRSRSYAFSIDVIGFLKTLPEKRVYWVIADQLLRSATSIGANIAEAKGSGTKKEFCRFLEIALKSANETKYWLSLLHDATDAEKTSVEKLLSESEALARMLGASLVTMRKKVHE